MTQDGVRARFIKTLVAGILGALMVVALIAVGHALMTADGRLQAKLDRLTGLAAAGLGEALVAGDAESVNRLVDAVTSDPDVARVRVLSDDGAVVAHRARADLADFAPDRPTPQAEMLLTRSMTITDRGQSVGAIEVVVSRWALFDAIGPDILGQALIVLALLSLIGLLVVKVADEQIVRPLSDLTAEAAALARPRTQREVPRDQPAAEFTTMAHTLEHLRLTFHKLLLDNRRVKSDAEREVAARTARLRRANEELMRAAAYDPVTQVYARDHFLTLAGGEYAAFRRHGHPTSVMMLDLDAIEDIELNMGPDAAREALKAVANCIRDTLRPTDLVGRMGDDEFGVLLRHTSGEHAPTPAERLRRRIEDLTFEWNGRAVPLKCAVGVASCEGAEDGIEPVFAQAMPGAPFDIDGGAQLATAH